MSVIIFIFFERIYYFYIKINICMYIYTYIYIYITEVYVCYFIGIFKF